MHSSTASARLVGKRETVIGEAPDGRVWACHTNGLTLAQHYWQHERLTAELIAAWKRHAARGKAKRAARGKAK